MTKKYKKGYLIEQARDSGMSPSEFESEVTLAMAAISNIHMEVEGRDTAGWTLSGDEGYPDYKIEVTRIPDDEEEKAD